jgi:hypothetical protein
MKTATCQNCKKEFKVHPKASAHVKRCPECRTEVNRQINKAWQRRRREGTAIPRGKKSDRNADGKPEKCRCPKCEEPHTLTLNFTGTRFYNSDGTEKPLRFLCHNCRLFASRTDPQTARIADSRGAGNIRAMLK